MPLDELEHRGVDRRPDRPRRDFDPGSHLDAVRHDRRREAGRALQLAHVLDGHDDLEVELLGATGVDDLDRPAAGDEARDLLERSLGGGQTDALDRLAQETLEPLEAQSEVRPTLRPGDRVHLVEDEEATPARASREPATSA